MSLKRLVSAVVACLSIVGPCFGHESKKPNIILIMSDDLGAECIGCYGSTQYKTPNLDKLAKTGLRFTHCYSQPLCTPSRVQIMTGLYNHRNYIGFGNMKEDSLTFGNILKKAGYKTCIVGKWQLAGDLNKPYRFGFDEYCLWQIDGRDQRYWKPRIVQNKKLLKEAESKYGPDVYCDYMLDFIERNKEGPFFCYFPMCLTHSPYVPTPDSKGPKTEKNRNKKYFGDMVQYMDKLVGKVVHKLDDLKIRDNTIVIFTSDNGTGRGVVSQTTRGPIHGGKGLMTNAGTHVPLIIGWPAKARTGKRLDDLIDFTDFVPTFVELSGASLPEGHKVDGRSFAPQLMGKKGRPREWIFCHYWDFGRRKAKAKEYARTQRYKLYNDGRFYDLRKDPLEKSPLGNPSSDDAAAARKSLRGAFKDVGSTLYKAP